MQKRYCLQIQNKPAKSDIIFWEVKHNFDNFTNTSINESTGILEYLRTNN